MNDKEPDKPVWLMRDKAIMATIQQLRRQGITTVADIARALNDQGITILIVTHEPDIAQYARRIVEVRDGQIRRDHAVDARRIAADDLAASTVVTGDVQEAA